MGRFPATIEGLFLLFNNYDDFENWRGPYSNRPYLYIDPWENNYIYFYPAKYGNSEYDLYSVGPNGIDEHGLGDDITNW
ncbi:MAG: type II secretion system protein GspG [Gammaproteobacteria bacterium]|nr:type II secretion system protein GspG [Gammaproteobacteria bacterium]